MAMEGEIDEQGRFILGGSGRQWGVCRSAERYLRY